jgi:transposase-like protein
MGRQKGGTNRYWSKESKLKLVKEYLEENKSSLEITRREQISNGMFNNWVKKYLEFGEEALENQKKPGNPYKGLNQKKDLTDIEKLQLENMKLKVENERLKKGYFVKGDGQIVVSSGIKDRNTK